MTKPNPLHINVTILTNPNPLLYKVAEAAPSRLHGLRKLLLNNWESAAEFSKAGSNWNKGAVLDHHNPNYCVAVGLCILLNILQVKLRLPNQSKVRSSSLPWRP